MFGSRFSPLLRDDPRARPCGSCGSLLYPSQICSCANEDRQFEERCKRLYDECLKTYGERVAKEEVAMLRHKHSLEKGHK